MSDQISPTEAARTAAAVMCALDRGDYEAAQALVHASDAGVMTRMTIRAIAYLLRLDAAAVSGALITLEAAAHPQERESAHE